MVRVKIMDLLYEKLPILRNGIQVHYRSPPFLDQAIREQNLIGWDLTVKGLLSKRWGTIQDEEYDRIREREKLEVWYTGDWWSKNLIKHIIFWALNEWQLRNDCLHKEKEQRRKDDQRREYHEEISNLYQQQEDKPIARVKRYFRIPLIDRLQHNPARQKQWIGTIRSLLDKVAMQNSKNKV